MKKSVIVVGAGLGGIATALRLANKGYSVTILEKNDKPGGRLNQIEKDGFKFDTGPSFFSMSYEFEQFAKESNIELGFKYFSLDPLYTVHVKKSGKKFYMYKDLKKLASQFKDVEPDFENKMNKYLAEASSIFNDTVNIVIKQNFDSFFEYFKALMTVNPKHLPKLTRNFWQQVCKYFKSDEARQLISLVAFFLGRTPFDTMAVYTLLSFTEFKHDGYHNVEGGMYNIINGLAKQFKEKKIKIVCNTEIVKVNKRLNTISSLVDNNGKEWVADCYAINSDASQFNAKYIKNKKNYEKNLQKKNWTMGYLTIYLGISEKLNNVDHHNYFIGDNYKNYSSNIFKENISLEKPYYYLNVLSKNNKDCAPEGCESLFIVCPVPNLLYKKDWSDKDEIVDSIIDDLSIRIDKDIKSLIKTRMVYTPEDWEKKFNLFKGSGLGLAHDMFQIGWFRAKNFDPKYNNLFYVGASTVPGAGLPISIISSKLCAERVEKYLK
jgi:phytoene desaturase